MNRLVSDLVPVLARQGAQAVILAGSWARGDAHRESDVDLWVIGSRLSHRALSRDGMIVNISRTTRAAERRKMRRPRSVGGYVPAWRYARVLHDPTGVARRLKAEARRFRWKGIRRECDRWVAEQMTGWAEEAIKLVRALGSGVQETAAVQRNLLAENLGFVMAVHRTVFWDSENQFWERIGVRVGGDWQRAQRDALGVGTRDFAATCHAALELYALTARSVWGTLSAEQREIVLHTLDVVRSPPTP